MTNSSVNKFIEDYIEKQKKSVEFIKTDDFKEDFESLRDYLKENRYFSTDGVYYTETEEEKEFADKAIQIFTTVDNNTDTHRNVPNANFPTMEIDYDGIIMSVTIGQGSLFSFWLE